MEYFACARSESRFRLVRHLEQLVHRHQHTGQEHADFALGRLAPIDVRLLRVAEYPGSGDNGRGPDARTTSIGTGPFVFKEWKQGESLTYSKYSSYWDTGKPYLDGFVATVVETKSALVQLEAGAIDLVKSEAVEDIVRLKQETAYQAIQHPFTGSFYEFGINVTQPPYDNKKVRQAFNHAIDRKRYAESLMQGLVKPLALFWSPTSTAYDEAKNAGLPFDLDKARSLLNEAGVSSLEADLLYIPNSYPCSRRSRRSTRPTSRRLGLR